MSKRYETKFDEFISIPERRLVFEKEALAFEATELIEGLMSQHGISRSDLAIKLGSSKAHVSQVLNGARNMTLHTLAEILFALDQKAHIDAFPLEPSSSFQRSSYLYNNRPWSLVSSSRTAAAVEPSLARTEDEPSQIAAA